MINRFLLALCALAILSSTALAAPTDCGKHYLDSTAPDILNEKKKVSARELCYSAFAVMHSGVTKTPLWSAEHLTRSSLSDAKGMTRTNNFHEEPRLPVQERAWLKDYARSGFDRGHLAPSADMPNAEAQSESFSLANMIPQDPNNNRNLWEGIESTVRKLAKKRGELYVISGPLFIGSDIAQLNGRLFIPTHIFKIVYDPRERKGAAYLVKNEATSDYLTLSIAEIEAKAQTVFFPTVKNKDDKLALPSPTPYSSRGGKKSKFSIF